MGIEARPQSLLHAIRTRNKAIAYFEATQHWSEQEVIDQVLTPLNDSALIETAQAAPQSIMCYWLPASIMTDGIGVPGGTTSIPPTRNSPPRPTRNLHDRDGIPDLVFIKTSNTGTGKVEVHVAMGTARVLGRDGRGEAGSPRH